MTLTLNHFTPPKGSTKTVLLTKSERKEIGRKNLADYVVRSFPAGTSVAVKSHGSYFRITRNASNARFEVRGTGRNFSNVTLLSDGNGVYVSPEFFSAWLAKYDSCMMLRILKLIDKNARDKESQRIQKEIYSFKPNFILVTIP